MNDEKVLKCKQIKIIIKTMEDKYRGLGKKIHLDTLCGNKFYRKEMTAIKYIQAMKILNTWRKYKAQKMLGQQRGGESDVLSPQAKDARRPHAEI